MNTLTLHPGALRGFEPSTFEWEQYHTVLSLYHSQVPPEHGTRLEGEIARAAHTVRHPGRLILAKATGGAEIAADSIDHLCRYIEMLFGVGTERARHLTDGDSE
jgi:hypothetical protein